MLQVLNFAVYPLSLRKKIRKLQPKFAAWSKHLQLSPQELFAQVVYEFPSNCKKPNENRISGYEMVAVSFEGSFKWYTLYEVNFNNFLATLLSLLQKITRSCKIVLNSVYLSGSNHLIQIKLESFPICNSIYPINF